jgi:tetratricopeptide (TPR) repeat protein
MGELIAFPWREHRMSPEEGWRAAEQILAAPIEERVGRARELRLEDPELLLCICEVLRSRVESSPGTARDDAEFFYQFLETPKRKIGLFDEREYFLGELALTAGGACRFLFRREEARRWFERSEAGFSLASNGLAHVARLAYQRLAMATEERRFDEVLELVPMWAESFTRMGLAEDALKCGFLEAAALHETGRTPEAITRLREICAKAEELRLPRLVAAAATNLAQDYRVLGDLKEAMVYARKALPLLEQLNNRVNLAKLRWCAGDILREQGKLGEAVSAYREALETAREVGIRGDQAALHLVLADALLDVGQDRQAEWEVRAALPIIDEEKMVPEGYAALGLLRDALRLRQVDRKALRELHGYFRDSQS